MRIPNILKETYSSTHTTESFSSYSLGKIAKIVEASRLEFFPEYTDHGTNHLELTLQTAIDLATPRALKHITALDAAVLSTATALHDLGMHVTRDGFETLIAPGSRWQPISEFDGKPWNELWDDFYAEASRFDGRKLRALFGEHYRPPRPLPEKGSSWEDFDRLLVGEFLRRHHHRLAHQIALHGMPAKDGESLQVCLRESRDHEFLADVSGLVARSHGMNLRPCIGYLEVHFQNRVNHRGVHAPFVMVLLRLADYFQIQASRAPTERTTVETFLSGFSEREWKVHQCIEDIHNTSKDPEAIIVNAAPKDVGSFLRLKNWLSGLQDELDRSWAVLGEVYGLQRHNKLNEIGIKIRRVKSNIDNVEEFSKTVSYVPENISFQTASSDLLKLLVGPLYGGNPGIGIRELIQNSVDAVREFDDLSVRRPELKKVERWSQDVDVLVEIECDDKNLPVQVAVTDRGVGMTADIVRDYFLMAGASFRKSDAWRRDHEDDTGHSRVLRTGRFGVGALAAFLLGDEIEVNTRHVASATTEGIFFKARIDTEEISVVRGNCPVGTRITIAIPEYMRKKVDAIVPGKWTKEIDSHHGCGHYFLKSPSLGLYFSHIGKRLPVKWFLPQPESALEPPRRSLRSEEFGTVFWTYDYKYPPLCCNGIPVIRGRWPHSLEYNIDFNLPNISLFDRNGLLPVNLQRNGLQASKLFLENEIVRSITDDLISYALVSDVEGCRGGMVRWRSPGFRAGLRAGMGAMVGV